MSQPTTTAPRLLRVPEPREEVREPDDRARRPVTGALDRLRQRVVGAVRERVAVDDEERLHSAPLQLGDRGHQPVGSDLGCLSQLAVTKIVQLDRRTVGDPQRAEPAQAIRPRDRRRDQRHARLRARPGRRPCAAVPRASSRSPFLRRVPSGKIATTSPSRASCTAVAIAPVSPSPRRTRNAPPSLDDRPEREPKELGLGHEADLAAREERQPEGPRIEVRQMVRERGRSRLRVECAPSRSTAAGRSAKPAGR